MTGRGAASLRRPLAALALVLLAQTAESRELHVRYQSVDFTYLDAGSADSLALGDTLLVPPQGAGSGSETRLVIEHLAGHSAACRILDPSADIRPGSVVRPLRVNLPREQGSPGLQAGAPASASQGKPGESSLRPAVLSPGPPGRTPSPAGQQGAEVNGYAALEWYHQGDRGPSRLTYDQPTLRLNLTARHLWGRDLTFRAKGRARHDHRQGSIGGSAPSEEWSNRLYAFSLSREAPEASFHWQAGRLLSRALPASVSIDGALAETRMGGFFWAGGFAGTIPDERTTAPRGSLQEYGVFLRSERGDDRSPHWSGALAVAGAYHGRAVSRQYAYLQNDFRSGLRWNAYQSGEVDLNGGWRRSGSAGTLSLSNTYFSLGFRPAPGSSLTLSYDNRRNFRTWENRSLPDSLFDRALSTGYRLQASCRIAAGTSLNCGAGWQHRQGQSRDTWSWNGGLIQERLLTDRLGLSLLASGFRGASARGTNPFLQVQVSLPSGSVLGVSGGAYIYSPDQGSAQRVNRWARLEGTWRLPSRYFLSGQVEGNRGADLRGERFLAEVGRNF